MFSELVDTIIRRTNRPDFKEDIIEYLNEVLRQVHCSEFFYRDRVEVCLNQDYDESNLQPTFVWERPHRLRAVTAVKYLDICYDDNRDSFPPNIPPGIGQANKPQFYYAVGNKFVFYRKGGLKRIALSYVTAPRRFRYYEKNKRPAVYDYANDSWTYLDQQGNYVTSLGSEEQDAAARELVGDWLLQCYDGMLSSGVATKLFSILSDPRMKVEYANFKENLRYVRTTEKFENTGEVGYDR